MGFEREQIGDCTLYRGDCYEIAPMLEVQALVTDPPYGVATDTDYQRFRDSSAGVQGHGHLRKSYAPLNGDQGAFDPCPWLDYRHVILWGANHYTLKLPLGSWLFWDKRASNGHALLSEGEMGWWNQGRSVYYFPHCWHGFARASENSLHVHPTQKPVALMAWSVQKTSGIVLDPFMGSGPTGAACVQLGRSFVGIEIEPRYFDTACQRIAEAYAQPDLFVSQPSLHVYQEALFV